MDAPKQLPGCLPENYTLDSMLTAEQFCTWQKVSRGWFSARAGSLPGVLSHSQQMTRIHPRSYIDANALQGSVNKRK
jgi:hypothetical protein